MSARKPDFKVLNRRRAGWNASPRIGKRFFLDAGGDESYNRNGQQFRSLKSERSDRPWVRKNLLNS